MGTINRMRLSLGALVGVIVALAACSSPSSDQPGGTGGVGGTGGSGGGSGGTGGGQCAGSCDDGFSCTIDTCVGGKCTHSIGPNTGSTACPTGQYCAADKGCIASPACASSADCTKIWSGDACKSNIECDAASSVCTFDVLDKDGDKHPPQICGGDDCDDSASAVHPGSSEGCNGKDDDCDGVVDNGATCMDALQSCQAGACACKPENLCGTACVDVATDRKHCGSCNNACDPLEDCTAGQCACRPENLCSGKCVSLGDVENCGSCGNKCPTPQGCTAVCNNGICGGKCP
ncbi:MAG: MopE-related protein [Patescibacteria group bacterium]